jgi:ATP-binding cassette, subfamily G (WHITE), member 2, SNQ2
VNLFYLFSITFLTIELTICLLFSTGVIQPFPALNWWKWMYYVSPYTYLVEGVLGQALGGQKIECSSIEYVTVTPPSNMSCGQYMNPYISFAGGYLTNPDATSGCQFCPMATTDQFMMQNFHVSYDHRWRDLGILCAFAVANVGVPLSVFLRVDLSFLGDRCHVWRHILVLG